MSNSKWTGTVISDGNGNFHFDFVNSDKQHKYFNGTFTSAIPPFSGTDPSNRIQLSPDDANLSGTYDIQSGSTVGAATVNIQLLNSDNGAKITFSGGNIWPNLDKQYPVQGSGKWSVALKDD